jgi:amino acid transporter
MSNDLKKNGGIAAAAGMSVLTLAIMNITAVVSLRGLPAEAEYGLSSIFYYTFAAIFFLIPVSLVAAELATGWPEKGGVFRWVGEAFGPRWGFVAIFLLWIESTIWFPTVLTFAAESPGSGDPADTRAPWVQPGFGRSAYRRLQEEHRVFQEEPCQQIIDRAGSLRLQALKDVRARMEGEGKSRGNFLNLNDGYRGYSCGMLTMPLKIAP